MLAAHQFKIFSGPITEVGNFAKNGAIADVGFKTCPYADVDCIGFLATVTSWVGTSNPILDLKIRHSPDASTLIDLGSYGAIQGNGVYLLPPEGLSTKLILPHFCVYVGELTNITSFNLEVKAICALS